MVNEAQKELLFEILRDLENQINRGEYYSYSREDLDEHIANVEKLFGVKYEVKE